MSAGVISTPFFIPLILFLLYRFCFWHWAVDKVLFSVYCWWPMLAFTILPTRTRLIRAVFIQMCNVYVPQNCQGHHSSTMTTVNISETPPTYQNHHRVLRVTGVAANLSRTAPTYQKRHRLIRGTIETGNIRALRGNTDLSESPPICHRYHQHIRGTIGL